MWRLKVALKWRCTHCAGPLVIQYELAGGFEAVCFNECEGYRAVGAGVDNVELQNYIKHERVCID